MVGFQGSPIRGVFFVVQIVGGESNRDGSHEVVNIHEYILILHGLSHL